MFDDQCRPAEWFLIVAGGRYNPAAYKVGLAVSYWLMPVALWAAAALMGLSGATRISTTSLAVLVAWSGPAVHLMELGDVSIPLVAALAVLVPCPGCVGPFGPIHGRSIPSGRF